MHWLGFVVVTDVVVASVVVVDVLLVAVLLLLLIVVFVANGWHETPTWQPSGLS